MCLRFVPSFILTAVSPPLNVFKCELEQKSNSFAVMSCALFSLSLPPTSALAQRVPVSPPSQLLPSPRPRQQGPPSHVPSRGRMACRACPSSMGSWAFPWAGALSGPPHVVPTLQCLGSHCGRNAYLNHHWSKVRPIAKLQVCTKGLRRRCPRFLPVCEGLSLAVSLSTPPASVREN